MKLFFCNLWPLNLERTLQLRLSLAWLYFIHNQLKGVQWWSTGNHSTCDFSRKRPCHGAPNVCGSGLSDCARLFLCLITGRRSATTPCSTATPGRGRRTFALGTCTRCWPASCPRLWPAAAAARLTPKRTWGAISSRLSSSATRSSCARLLASNASLTVPLISHTANRDWFRFWCCAFKQARVEGWQHCDGCADPQWHSLFGQCGR